MSNNKSTVLAEYIENVLLITLNRPERHNALNSLLNHELGELVSTAVDFSIQAIVITGAGDKAFCAGGDMLEMSGLENNSELLPPINERKNAVEELLQTPIPVIAAINGYCYGGGARLAIACDMRLASDNATFRLPGVEYGLVVGAASLPRLVGAAKAKEWILTARKFDASAALDAGLVNSMHSEEQLLSDAIEMAKLIASHSSEAVQASKRIIDMATISEEATVAENEANQRLRGSDEQTQRFRTATKKVTGK